MKYGEEQRNTAPKALLPRMAVVGIIGGGFGGLLTYVLLRFRGVRREDILVFSGDASPEKMWLNWVRNIRQKLMRSESIQHFFPTDAPGLATVEAIHYWTIKPILQSWFDRYHPSVDVMVHHILRVSQQVGFFRSLVPIRIERVVRDTNESFALYSATGVEARVRHVIMAVGHGPRLIPQPIRDFYTKYPNDARVTHAFEEKDYMAGETVLVVGDGLTSAHEWMAALERGSNVIAVSMRGFKFGQALNTPREYFSKRGYAPWRLKNDAERLAELQEATRGTLPNHAYWTRQFNVAKKEGRLQMMQGELTALEQSAHNITATIRMPDGATRMLTIQKVVCATGFAPAIEHPLLRDLITTYDIPVIGNVIKVDNMFCVPTVSYGHSCMFLTGQAAYWGNPCADSLGGMKIIARTIAATLLGRESWKPREVWFKTQRWFTMVTGRELV